MSKKSADPAPIDDDSIHRACVIFALLRDPTRSRILALLDIQARNVGEICDQLGMSQPSVSHHLALLRVSGTVGADRSGRHNFYSLTPKGDAAIGAIRALSAGPMEAA